MYSGLLLAPKRDKEGREEGREGRRERREGRKERERGGEIIRHSVRDEHTGQ